MVKWGVALKRLPKKLLIDQEKKNQSIWLCAKVCGWPDHTFARQKETKKNKNTQKYEIRKCRLLSEINIYLRLAFTLIYFWRNEIFLMIWFRKTSETQKTVWIEMRMEAIKKEQRELSSKNFSYIWIIIAQIVSSTLLTTQKSFAWRRKFLFDNIV